MQRYILIRLSHAVIVLFFVSLIIFSLSRVTGDPLEMLLPDEATEEDFARVKATWGLDRPLHVQYLVFLGNAAKGNFGDSVKWPGLTARELVVSRLPATLQLAVFSLVVSAIMALPIGVIAAVKKDSGYDYVAKVIALIGQSAPSFAIGLILMWIFAVTFSLVPTSGKGGISHMILPAVALGWFQVAAVARLTRSSMLEVLDTEYVKLARVKGVAEWKVIWKHCLRNAALAPLTYFGLILGGFVTGSVVIETIFAWPGVGLLAIDALRARDFMVVQTVVVFFAFIYIAASLLVDIMYAYLDPRIRYS